MNIWLKELSINDGKEFFDLLMELASYKGAYAKPVPDDFSYEEFDSFKRMRIRLKNNDNIPDYAVPTNTYWIMDDDKPIGYGTIKHKLNENQKGGHFGLCLLKEYQNRGIGMIVSDLMSEIAYNDLNIKEVIYTAKKENSQSVRSLEKISGVFVQEKDGYYYYKVNLEEKYKKEGRKKI